MKRTAAALLVVGTLAGCTDTGNLSEPSQPSFAVSDGAHTGTTVDGKPANTRFYFLPPLVPSPSYSGVFNPSLKPTVIVSGPFTPVLRPDGRLDLPTDVCVPGPGPAVKTFLPSQISVDPVGELYQVGFQTGTLLQTGKAYRICVKVGPISLGYRDILPDASGADVPRNPEQLPLLQFNNGSTLPIKFRIERTALCSSGVGTGGVEDCTEFTAGAAGGTGICVGNTCALDIPAGALQNDVLFVIERLTCTGSTLLPIDNPQYPGCLLVRTPELGSELQFQVPTTVAGCIYETPSNPDQVDLLQLHHLRDDGSVEALPNTYSPIDFDCEQIIQGNSLAADASAWQRMRHYAKAGWRTLRKAVAPWAAPEPAYAINRGFGGHTEFTSPFVWALPSQMERVSWSNPVIATSGQTVQPTVLVTDEGLTDTCADGTPGCTPVNVPPQPVEGARVWFRVLQGDGTIGTVPVLTGANGIAQLPWTFNTGGLHVLEAYGYGLGVKPPAGTGPYAAHFPPNGVPFDAVVPLGTGRLPFNGVVCDASQTPNQADGKVNPGEYANQTSFTAKVSGGAANGTLYWGNDCHNLYFALEVAAPSELNNELRLVFDNDNDGIAEVGDDQWNLKRDSKTGLFEISDRFLSSNCIGSKQSDCGTDDTADGGTNDLQGGIVGYNPVTGITTWEIRHPFTGDAAHDLQVDIAQGTTVGVYIVLQLGKGAQGNTEFPGFRQYLPIVIPVPGAPGP